MNGLVNTFHILGQDIAAMTDFLLRAVHSLLCLVNHFPELRCWALALEMKQLTDLGG